MYNERNLQRMATSRTAIFVMNMHWLHNSQVNSTLKLGMVIDLYIIPLSMTLIGLLPYFTPCWEALRFSIKQEKQLTGGAFLEYFLLFLNSPFGARDSKSTFLFISLNSISLFLDCSTIYLLFSISLRRIPFGTILKVTYLLKYIVFSNSISSVLSSPFSCAINKYTSRTQVECPSITLSFLAFSGASLLLQVLITTMLTISCLDVTIKLNPRSARISGVDLLLICSVPWMLGFFVECNALSSDLETMFFIVFVNIMCIFLLAKSRVYMYKIRQKIAPIPFLTAAFFGLSQIGTMSFRISNHLSKLFFVFVLILYIVISAINSLSDDFNMKELIAKPRELELYLESVEGLQTQIHLVSHNPLKLIKLGRVVLFGSSSKLALFFNKSQITNLLQQQKILVDETMLSLNELICLSYIKMMKRHPKNLKLRLSYIMYLIDIRGSSTEAFNQLMGCYYYSKHFFELIRFSLLETILYEKVKLNQSDITLNTAHIEILQTKLRFRNDLEKAGSLILGLWHLLEEDRPSIGKITSAILGFNTIQKRVVKVWNKKSKVISGCPKLKYIYGIYVGNVLNMENESYQILREAHNMFREEEAHKNEFKNMNIPKDDYSFTGKGIIVLHFQQQEKMKTNVTAKTKNIISKIYNCNISIALMLKHTRKEDLNNKSIERIMPKDIAALYLDKFSKGGNLRISNQLIYLTTRHETLNKFTCTQKKIDDSFLIMELIPVWHFENTVEILGNINTNEIVGHTTELMKYFELRFYTLKAMNITEFDKLRQSKKDSSKNTSNQSIPKDDVSNTNASAKHRSQRPSQISYEMINGNDMIIERERFFNSLRNQKIEEDNYVPGNLEKSIGIVVLRIKAPSKEIASQKIKDAAYSSQMQASNTQFSFRYDILVLSIVGGVCNQNESELAGNRSHTANIIKSVLMKEKKLSKITAKIDYSEGIGVSRLNNLGYLVDAVQDDYEDNPEDALDAEKNEAQNSLFALKAVSPRLKNKEKEKKKILNKMNSSEKNLMQTNDKRRSFCSIFIFLITLFIYSSYFVMTNAITFTNSGALDRLEEYQNSTLRLYNIDGAVQGIGISLALIVLKKKGVFDRFLSVNSSMDEEKLIKNSIFRYAEILNSEFSKLGQDLISLFEKDDRDVFFNQHLYSFENMSFISPTGSMNITMNEAVKIFISNALDFSQLEDEEIVNISPKFQILYYNSIDFMMATIFTLKKHLISSYLSYHLEIEDRFSIYIGVFVLAVSILLIAALISVVRIYARIGSMLSTFLKIRNSHIQVLISRTEHFLLSLRSDISNDGLHNFEDEKGEEGKTNGPQDMGSVGSSSSLGGVGANGNSILVNPSIGIGRRRTTSHKWEFFNLGVLGVLFAVLYFVFGTCILYSEVTIFHSHFFNMKAANTIYGTAPELGKYINQILKTNLIVEGFRETSLVKNKYNNIWEINQINIALKSLFYDLELTTEALQVELILGDSKSPVTYSLYLENILELKACDFFQEHYDSSIAWKTGFDLFPQSCDIGFIDERFHNGILITFYYIWETLTEIEGISEEFLRTDSKNIKTSSKELSECLSSSQEASPTSCVFSSSKLQQSVLFYLKVYGSVMYQISSSMGAEEFRDHRNQAKSIGLYSNYANAVFLVFLVAWLAKIMVVDQYGRSVKSVLEYVPDFMVR